MVDRSLIPQGYSEDDVLNPPKKETTRNVFEKTAPGPSPEQQKQTDREAHEEAKRDTEALGGVPLDYEGGGQVQDPVQQLAGLLQSTGLLDKLGADHSAVLAELQGQTEVGPAPKISLQPASAEEPVAPVQKQRITFVLDGGHTIRTKALAVIETTHGMIVKQLADEDTMTPSMGRLSLEYATGFYPLLYTGICFEDDKFMYTVFQKVPDAG